MSVTKSAPTERFSDRVDDYVKYRPHYSPDIVNVLRDACGLASAHVVADVGCGTGLLAKTFLENGNPVIGVEPNAEMRRAGEHFLSEFGKFSMADGTAEETTLPAHSADFVVAGQAFHWFRPEPTRTEFARIVKPSGWVVLVWHDRDMESTPFLRAYEDFLQRHATDYSTVAHNKVANYGALEQFYSPDPMRVITQSTQQYFDLEGLRGRLLSSSYAPREGPRAEEMLQQLPELFQKHAENGQVTFEYFTRIYYGHLTA
ncbi:MAG: class I SAM-dependent methyltransferase [Candidatus Korobacteraceae bacterium]